MTETFIAWQSMLTCPPDGKVLLAQYAPTNWAFYVGTVFLDSNCPPRHRLLQLRYARAWAPYPPEPDENVTQAPPGDL